MSDLPVFAFCETDAQIAQLRSFFRGLGAGIGEESSGNLAKDVSELVDNCEVVGKMENEADADMVLNSLTSLVVVVPVDEAPPIVRRFCEKLSGPAFKGKSVTTIRVLSNLFHGFGGSSLLKRLQYDIYCSLLKAAEGPQIIRQIPTDLGRVTRWMEEWGVETEERRRLLRLLHEALARSQQSEAPSQVMIALLATYTEADAASAKADARECVRASIADPGTFVFDHLLALRPVQSLTGDKIYELLQIFVGGSLGDYLKFYEGNKQLVEGLGVPHEATLDKMRVLTLMTLGETRSEISFEELSKHLQLPVGEELEEFVVKAVQSKMVKAKMDQMKQRLIIGGVTNRSFGKAQWEQLRSKLDSWASSLHQVKGYLDSVAAES